MAHCARVALLALALTTAAARPIQAAPLGAPTVPHTVAEDASPEFRAVADAARVVDPTTGTHTSIFFVRRPDHGVGWLSLDGLFPFPRTGM
jgi:hypothetical protein